MRASRFHASPALLALVLLAVRPRGLAAQDRPYLVRASASPCLNVRPSPDTGSEPFTCLVVGTEVIAIATAAEWRRIRLPDARTGWAAKEYLEPVPAPASDARAAEDLSALRARVESLQVVQRELRNELQQLRLLVERSGSGGGASQPEDAPIIYLDTVSSPAKGAATAPVTVVEFSDYHCAFCGRYFRETFARLEAEYVATGLVRYVFRDFPILSLHPRALAAASGARCAGEQGRYWEMHDVLFASQRASLRDSLTNHARVIGLDSAAFAICMASGRHAAAIRRGLRDGSAAGVRGTPTFFVTVGEPGESRVRVVRVIHGAQPFSQFKKIIDDVLRRQNAEQ